MLRVKMPESADVLLQRIIVDETSLWKDLVLISEMLWGGGHSLNLESILTDISLATKTSPKSPRRKFQAICFLLRKGFTVDQICDLGPTETMSSYSKSFESVNEKLGIIRLRIPKTLRDSFLAQLDRVGTVIGNSTRQGQLEFLNSLLTGLDEQQVLHLAGVHK